MLSDGKSLSTSPPAAAGWLATGFVALLVFAAALISRTGMLDLPPIYDELYHLIPAMSWQETSTFAILDGTYERASIYTRLVVLGFDLAGERSTAAARFLPSVLPGALLVALVFVWTRLVAGWVAAAIVAVFTLFWPNGIEVSQYIRFYALHGLAFLLAAFAIYDAVTAQITRWVRMALLAAAAVLLLFALKLQLMTLVGTLAIGIWVALVFGPTWLRMYHWLRWVVLFGLLLVAGVLASGIFGETLQKLWTTYRWEPWPAPGDITFYHRNFRDNYPTFWPLFPFAALVALRTRFIPASFCIILFATAFVVHSFGGLKSIRYLYTAMPLFFVVWGIAIEAIGKSFVRYFRATAKEALAPLIQPIGLRGAAVAVALSVSFLFLLGANAAFERAFGLIRGNETAFLLGKRRWEWEGVRELIDPLLKDGAVIVTSEELLAVQWLGDYDLAFNKPRFSEMVFLLGPQTQPFTPDIRTGRPIAGEVEDFRPIIACAAVGVFLANAGWSDGLDARRLERIAEETGAKTTTARAGGMSMLSWRRPSAEGPANCPDLPGVDSMGAAERILSGATQPRLVSSAITER